MMNNSRSMIKPRQFLADRREVLLSMDIEKFRAYMRRYGQNPPSDDSVALIAMHMARTGAKDLPMRERIISKKWLLKRGLRTMDDAGEIPEELED